MKLYIYPKKEEEELMGQIDVPAGAVDRVHEKFAMSINQKSSKRFFGISVIIFSGAVAALILMIATQPESSFIDQAIAASRVKAAMMQEGDVRHIILLEDKDTENVSEREIWLSSDGKSWLEINTQIINGVRGDVDMWAYIDDVQYVTPSDYEAEIELDRMRKLQYSTALDIDRPLFNFILPEGAVSMSNRVQALQNDWIVCQESTRGLESAVEGQKIEQNIQELLGFGEQMNVQPNFTAAITELASSPMVVDIGEKMMDEIGKVHVYRLSYQDTAMNDYSSIINRGTDFIFDIDTKELRGTVHWYMDPEVKNEGRSTVMIEKDEIIKFSTTSDDYLNPATYGLVAAPIIEDEHSNQNILAISLPEDGCYSIGTDGKIIKKIAENEAEASLNGFFD